nr:hypothetical protein [Nocardia cyriacigeorgica]
EKPTWLQRRIGSRLDDPEADRTASAGDWFSYQPGPSAAATGAAPVSGPVRKGRGAAPSGVAEIAGSAEKPETIAGEDKVDGETELTRSTGFDYIKNRPRNRPGEPTGVAF